MHEDAQLILRSQQGDIQAFEELVIKYEKKVYTIAYKYMGNHEDASDQAQEAFIKAYQAIGSFRNDASFGTWIGRIVANKCLDELRKRKRYQTTSLDDEITTDEGSVKKELKASDASPEEQMEQKETAAYLQELIDGLKPEYKAVVMLRELEGYSYEEISQQLDCSLGTIKSRLSRARKYLKDQIIHGRKEV